MAPISSSRADAGSAPGWEKIRTPSRKAIRVGMDEMPAAPESSRSASVSTLPKTMSECFSAAFSKTGANIRHGPHQEAHQSTSRMSLSLTAASKLSAVRLTVAMGLLALGSCPV